MNRGRIDEPEEYVFRESLFQIIDDTSHPLHKAYIEALRTIRRPCSHGAVILEDNPNDVFSEGVMEFLLMNNQTHLLPIQEAMCDDFTREYQLYAYLGSGCKLNLFLIAGLAIRLSLRSSL
jgi:hypothetical protein